MVCDRLAVARYPAVLTRRHHARELRLDRPVRACLDQRIEREAADERFRELRA